MPTWQTLSYIYGICLIISTPIFATVNDALPLPSFADSLEPTVRRMYSLTSEDRVLVYGGTLFPRVANGNRSFALYIFVGIGLTFIVAYGIVLFCVRGILKAIREQTVNNTARSSKSLRMQRRSTTMLMLEATVPFFFLGVTVGVFTLAGLAGVELGLSALVMSVFVAIVPAVQNFDPPSTLAGCIFADKKRVLIWNARDHVLYEGEEADNGLSFRELNTSGDMPDQIFGFAFCLYKGSLIIYGGMTVNNATSTETYELNLNTLAWSRRKTIATQVLSSPSHRLPRRFEHVTIAGGKVYFMKDANLGFQIVTLVSVLETDPTIFQRSAPYLRSSRFGRSVVKKLYPKSVNEQSGQKEETRKQCQLSHIF
ncbi:hypothetical protein PRIPAC_77480 [Pristionchus pacificus]|uniref:Uncharacterized protein n=1 Tax=Pristionchus pacificus TaxID=54126 RepID=A0A2A6C3S9_PRIPA|nr:hypothetical protein PRIPAC_77480 [Pristionchus pacificus]|eukprot:PDM72892.1 hypothetical protein PRIPAC_39326 [Pristionchus pacificus]